jgi:predicted Zn-dependent peptidase
MDHAAKLEEQDFNKKFYIPNNAVLVAGDFNAAQTKEWIQKNTSKKKELHWKRNFRRRTNHRNYQSNFEDQTFKSQWLAAYRTPSDEHVMPEFWFYLNNFKWR